MSTRHDGLVEHTSGPPLVLRAGAAGLAVAAHLGVLSLLFLNQSTPAQLADAPAVIVSLVEAPEWENALGELDGQPEQPAAAEPPPPEPEPEPEPVVENPPEPVAPKPEPKPKPKPQPKPEPRPEPKPEPKPPTPQAAPSQNPSDTPADKPAAAPLGRPDGNPEDKALQGPNVGSQPSDGEPVLVSKVNYVGQRPVPVYSSTSKRLREQGLVVVLVTISAEGMVENASIDRSSGYQRLDDAALDAARKARFRPYMRNGQPQRSRAKLPYNFSMKN